MLDGRNFGKTLVAVSPDPTRSTSEIRFTKNDITNATTDARPHP